MLWEESVNPCPAELIKMPHPLLIFSQSDYLIQIVAIYSYSADSDQLASSEFVCVEVLRPSQPNGVMSSAVSLPNYTFNGQA